MTDSIIVVCEDLSGSDPSFITALGFMQVEPIPAMTYVVIGGSSGRRRWFGIVSRPNLNLNQASLGPYHPVAMDALKSIGKGEYEASLLIQQVYLYQIELSVMDDGGRLSGASIRPDIGSIVRLAVDAEIAEYLGLPSYGGAFEVGTMAANGAPIEIGPREYDHQMLLGGTTGGGKTNTLANLIFNAQENGYWVFIFDPKPDFQDTDRPNSELACGGRPLPKTSRYCLTRDEERLLPGERRIRVRPSELNVELFAATLFSDHGDNIQKDAFEDFAREESEDNSDWSLESLLVRIEEAIESKKMRDYDIKTMKAMRRKLRTRWTNKLFWVSTSDPSRRSIDLPGASSRSKGEHYLSIDAEMKPGCTTILRLDPLINDGYALFVEYVGKQIYACKTKDDSKPPVLIIIEEAQDILQAGIRSDRDITTRCLLTQIRKGRSKGIGHILSVQSASCIPDDIMNLMNTRIIHAHRSAKSLDEVLNVDEATARMVMSFGPGEALLSIFGAKAIVHGRMHQSPFELTKGKSPWRTPLSDDAKGRTD